MAIFKRKTAAKSEEGTQETASAPKKASTKAAKAVKTEKAEEKRDVLKAQGGVVSAHAARTLLAPLVTEKTAHLADAGVYAFRVPVSADRVSVRNAFKELYKVTPTAVRIMRVHGKEHRFGRFMSRAADWKKALITVPSGSRVDIFAL